MDDLFTLIVFALFVLFGLMSSAKKKRPPQAPRPKPPTSVPTPAPTRPARDLPSRREPERVQVEKPGRTLAEELLELLKQQAEPETAAPPVPEPYRPVLLPDLDDEARPLESLEPLSAESHEEFHERYVAAAQPPEPAGEKRRERRPLTQKELRRAFVMKEILGPPRGLQ